MKKTVKKEVTIFDIAKQLAFVVLKSEIKRAFNNPYLSGIEKDVLTKGFKQCGEILLGKNNVYSTELKLINKQKPNWRKSRGKKIPMPVIPGVIKKYSRIDDK